MGKKPSEGLKQSIFLAFLVVGVLFVLLIWTDNLIEKDSGSGFVRERGAPTLQLTPTSTRTPAANPQADETTPPLTPTLTPAYRDSGDIGLFWHGDRFA